MSHVYFCLSQNVMSTPRLFIHRVSWHQYCSPLLPPSNTSLLTSTVRSPTLVIPLHYVSCLRSSLPSSLTRAFWWSLPIHGPQGTFSTLRVQLSQVSTPAQIYSWAPDAFIASPWMCVLWVHPDMLLFHCSLSWGMNGFNTHHSGRYSCLELVQN